MSAKPWTVREAMEGRCPACGATIGLRRDRARRDNAPHLTARAVDAFGRLRRHSPGQRGTDQTSHEECPGTGRWPDATLYADVRSLIAEAQGADDDERALASVANEIIRRVLRGQA